MKKRSLAFLLAVVMGLSLTACSKTDGNEKKEDKDKEELSAEDVVFSYEGNDEYITIPEDYLGIEVPAYSKVTDEELQKQIGYTRHENIKTEQILEGTVKEGDKVNLTSVATLEGETEPIESNEYDFTIGEEELIEGYEEGLIGAKVGDTVTMNLKFPEDYLDDSVSGKNATFQVTINYIHGASYVPEWTDELAQELSNGSQKNTADYEAALRKEMQAEKDKETFYKQQTEIIQYLVENSTVHKFPEGLVESQYDAFIEEYKQDNEQNYGYDNFEDYVKEVAEYGSMEDFEEYVQECAENAAIELLAYQAVGAKEKIELTKGEYDNLLQSFASSQGYTTASKFENDFMEIYGKEDKDYLNKKFINTKILNYLQEHATQVDMEPVSLQ